MVPPQTTIENALEALDDYARRNRDRCSMRPPASESDLAAFAKWMGSPIPSDYEVFLRHCNGFAILEEGANATRGEAEPLLRDCSDKCE